MQQVHGRVQGSCARIQGLRKRALRGVPSLSAGLTVKNRKEKREDWDDGRTIAPMTGEELPSYRRAVFSGRENKRVVKSREKSDISRKERRAMMRAMFAVLLPRFLIVLASFGLVALLLWLWLR